MSHSKQGGGEGHGRGELSFYAAIADGAPDKSAVEAPQPEKYRQTSGKLRTQVHISKPTPQTRANGWLLMVVKGRRAATTAGTEHASQQTETQASGTRVNPFVTDTWDELSPHTLILQLVDQKQGNHEVLAIEQHPIGSNESDSPSSTALTMTENRQVLACDARYIPPWPLLGEHDPGFNDFMEQMFLTNHLYVKILWVTTFTTLTKEEMAPIRVRSSTKPSHSRRKD